jgi:type III secretory pathway component EscV
LVDLEHKKKVLVYMEMEYNSLPKDVTRTTYLKRINEIVGGLKG